MTTPAPARSPAEIRDAIYVLRGMNVYSAGADTLNTAVRVAVDVMEEQLQALEVGHG